MLKGLFSCMNVYSYDMIYDIISYRIQIIGYNYPLDIALIEYYGLFLYMLGGTPQFKNFYLAIRCHCEIKQTFGLEL